MYIISCTGAVELATMCLGLLSHRRGCMSNSSACCQQSSLSGIMMSQSELGVPGDQIQYHAWDHAYESLYRAFQVVRIPFAHARPFSVLLRAL